MKINSMIEASYPKFTKTEIQIAEFILSNPDISKLTLSEMAQLLNVGEATIVRFCRKLKFQGYQDFKFTFMLEKANQKV